MKIFFMLLFPVLSFATSEYKTLDLNQFNKIDSNSTAGSKVKFSSGCKSKSGADYKAGETGYETCMRDAETDKNKGKKEGSVPSVGFTIGE